MKMKKNARTPALILSVFVCASFLILSYYTVWTHDDLLTKTSSLSEVIRNSFYFGNGRYVGNCVCSLFMPYKLLDTLFRGLSLSGVVILLASVFSSFSPAAIGMSWLLVLGFGNLIIREAVIWGHGFYNFVPPVFLVLLALLLLKRYYIRGRTLRPVLTCVSLLFIGILQQLFSEKSTCAALLISLILLIFTRIKKAKSLPAVSWFAGSVVGAFIMFALPSLTHVSYKMDEYRGAGVGAESLSVFVRQFGDNLLTSLKSLVVMVPVWTVVSLLLIVQVKRSGSEEMRPLRLKPLWYALFALQPVLSLIAFLVNEKHLKERVPFTSIRISDLSGKIVFVICLIFVAYLAGALLVLFLDPSVRGNRIAYGTILSVCAASVGELLIITVMGPRCLFFTACILAGFILYYCDSERRFTNRLTKSCLIGGGALAVYLTVILFQVTAVNKVRFDYAKRQLAERKDVIEIIRLPHAKWLHVPDESLGYAYYFNYGEVKEYDDYTYITYEEYLKRADGPAMPE